MSETESLYRPETPKIYAAMAKVMGDIVAIGKDSTNQQQGFKYRSIDAVYNALNPLLAKHGIFTTPEVLDKTREERVNAKGTTLAFTCLRVRYTFWADDGSSVSCVVEGEGMDSGDKSSNKAMAVAHKYALLQTFCIPTEEQKDPDADTHEVAPNPHRAHLLADLQAVADEGYEQYKAAWLAMKPEEKLLVGAVDHAALVIRAKKDKAKIRNIEKAREELLEERFDDEAGDRI